MPQRARVEPGLAQDVAQHRDEARLAELARGDVDADRQAGAARELAPLGELRARRAQHLVAERDGEAGLVGHRQHLGGLAVRPAARAPRSRRCGRSPPARSAGRRPRARASSIARRRSPSMSSRRMTCSCIAASNTAWRPLPSALARYIATSASRITCSGADFAVASAIPIDAPMNSSRPSISNGACRLCRTRSAITVASCGSQTSSSSSVNSSPLRRATVSFGRSADSSRRATACSSWSPTGVAEPVVDDLEAVEVEEQHRGAALGVVALGAPDRLVEAVHEQHAVRQAGQRVVQRVVLQAALGLAAVGDVGDAADDARRAAVLVADRDRRARASSGSSPSRCWTRCSNSKWSRRRAGQVRVERLRERRAVVGVDAAQPLAARLADLDLAVAEHALPARRVVDAVGR